METRHNTVKIAAIHSKRVKQAEKTKPPPLAPTAETTTFIKEEIWYQEYQGDIFTVIYTHIQGINTLTSQGTIVNIRAFHIIKKNPIKT